MCKIGLIDSGSGGISTLSALLKLLPDEEYIYVADRSHCPYGDKSEDFIYARVVQICRMLHGMGASAVVLACNTATNVCIDRLRKNAPVPLIFVGVEPAVKPAVAELNFGKALVLVTTVTASQSKFVSLTKEYGKDRLLISPQPTLANLIENNICNLRGVRAEVEEILSPLAGADIESVVLGCTHYCLIKDDVRQIFGAKIYDGNAGTAVRLYCLLSQKQLISRTGRGSVRFMRL